MAQKTKYDQMIELYRGEIPRALVLGLIRAESNFKEGAVNDAPDAPGGGPKVGLMQPSRAALKDVIDVNTAKESFLKNPANNIRVGCTILNDYWKRLRRDFPTGFVQGLERDANAAAVLVHAYTFGYAAIADLMRQGSTTSYRELGRKFPADRGIVRHWPERVLDAARHYGYTQILAGSGALTVPPPGGNPWAPGGGGSGGSISSGGKSSSVLLWVLGAAALGGVAYVATKKKRRRAA